MKKISKKQMLKLITTLPDGEEKRRFIAMLVTSGEITEGDLSEMMIADIHQNLDRYAEMFKQDDVLVLLWNRFKDYPQYLARALVRVRPDVFYAYGFAFRLTMKLRGKLGPIVVPPRRPGEVNDGSVFVKELSEQVRADLLELDRERCFRTHLYAFSRDTGVGYELLDEAILATTNDYDGTMLQNVRDYYERLLAMRFPGFIDQISDYVFPSPHVRWWIEKSAGVDRILNIGDTGTQKTAYAVLASEHFGCRRVLVTCPPHARVTWRTEIEQYYLDSSGKVAVVENRRGVSKALDAAAQFTIIGYSTLIKSGVAEALFQAGFDSWIWDESHYGNRVIGGKPAQRAQKCQDLARAGGFKRTTCLTATPFEKHPSELAAIASVLRTDMFPTPQAFRQARPDDPRFLRELFDKNILEIELREIMDLPPITPQPWEDLFGATRIKPNPRHRAVYDHVLEDETVRLAGSQKVQRLLLTAVHPHKVEYDYDWPEPVADSFSSWRLSTKLDWLKRKIGEQHECGAKVVVATGIFAEGITRPEDADDPDEIWVGKLLAEWFGNKHVLVLDQNVSTTIDENGSSERDRMIKRWREDPDAWLLLVSMRCCPDNVNLSVPALPGIKKLYITALSYPWVPWKQFQGRFWRPGLGVPVEYEVPVLVDTLDEGLLGLGQKKWHVQTLFRAQVPLTADEMAVLSNKVNVRMLADEARSDVEKVNLIGIRMQGRGSKAAKMLEDTYGVSTYGEVFARAFLATQQYATAGHIARFMAPVIQAMEEQGLVHDAGILDAGCGPLTLERFLGKPVYGLDINPHMIRLGKLASVHSGVNARTGELSQLPDSWTHQFELTVASLVLDWTSLRERSNGISHRLAVLKKLVQVTNPFGRIWLTMTESSLDSELLESWVSSLRGQGFVVVDEMTGLVRATDHQESGQPFSFWSVCFSPNGRPFYDRETDAYRFLFETERIKRKTGRDQTVTGGPKKQRKVEHQEFDVTTLSGTTVDMLKAAKKAAEQEVIRIAKVGDVRGWRFHRRPTLSELDWRVLTVLEERGLLDRLK